MVRLDRKSGFTVLPNGMLRDKRLTLKTKGLFAVLASLPPNWDYNISGLSVICGVGRDAIRTALRELEEAGYLERSQLHGASGTFAGCVYVIHEDSRDPPQEEDVQPLSGFPTTVDPTTVDPTTVDPTTDKPTSVNPTELNKDLIKERLSKPPISPTGGASVSVREKRPKHKPERFEGFFEFYPRHVKRDRAIAAWDKLKPDDELIAVMGRALQLQAAYWRATETESKYIPHAATWLNQRRWEDPPEEYRLSGRAASASSVGSGGWAEDPEVL